MIDGSENKTMSEDAIVFDFGGNWISYSQRALKADKLARARTDFSQLTEGVELKEKSFLDIGFGQGISLLLATEKGAQTVGIDINVNCEKALAITKEAFPSLKKYPNIIIGSILDQEVVSKLAAQVPGGQYDIVHSWGVLHHTGAMYDAINKSISLVKPEGHFFHAIYNRHWTSHIWKPIKWFYNKAPKGMQKLMIRFFAFLSSLAGYKNKDNSEKRGMDFYHDVIDWVGGFPYEFASKAEIETYLSQKGFSLLAFYPTNGYTGCNEFVFKKSS
jgi:2-polyprenyl-6-hydroxyphenyl methylase/3-demethylubiquinone-9 3-methyltransferase